jgi:hypothetical protein
MIIFELLLGCGCKQAIYPKIPGIPEQYKAGDF